MVCSTERRMRTASTWSSAAICCLMVMSSLRMTAARTWETVVDSSVYILLDNSMTRQIPESDPVFTETDMGSDLSTSEPNPTQEPSYAPSLRPTTHSPSVTPAPTGPSLPTMTPHPSPFYAREEGPTSAPTVRYENSDLSGGCLEGELLHDVLMYDIWGDGWNGRNLSFSIKDSPAVITKAVNKTEGNTTEVIIKTTVVNGSDYLLPGTRIFDETLPPGLEVGYAYACIRPGVCYQATISGGMWSDEIRWEVRRTKYNVNPVNNDGIIIAKGGAPSTCVFSIPDETVGYTLCKTTCSFFPGDPTAHPTVSPTDSPKPSSSPSLSPSSLSSASPSIMPTPMPTPVPMPIPIPTQVPTQMPTSTPIDASTALPVVPTSQAPSLAPLPTLGSGVQPSPPGSGTVIRPLPGTPETLSPLTPMSTPVPMPIPIPTQVPTQIPTSTRIDAPTAPPVVPTSQAPSLAPLPTLGSGVQPSPPGSDTVIRPLPGTPGTLSPTSAVFFAPDTPSPTTGASEIQLPTPVAGQPQMPSTQLPSVAGQTQIPSTQLPSVAGQTQIPSTQLPSVAGQTQIPSILATKTQTPESEDDSSISAASGDSIKRPLLQSATISEASPVLGSASAVAGPTPEGPQSVDLGHRHKHHKRPLPLSPTVLSPTTEPPTENDVQSPTMSAASPAISTASEPVETLVLHNSGGFRRNLGEDIAEETTGNAEQ